MRKLVNVKRENEKEGEVTDPMRIELTQKKKTRGGVRFVLRCAALRWRFE